MMEIATNAVLTALLLEASSLCKSINAPLPLPLESSNVVAFRTYATWNQADSDLHSYLAYKGGYEFRFAHGFINDFNTRESASNLQNPTELAKLAGEVRYNEQQCLGKVRDVFRSLGLTNVALLKAMPQVTQPISLPGATVPRFIFKWGDPKYPGAEVEVNASRLTIENLYFGSREFWRKPWPITFGTSNNLSEVIGQPAAARPKRSELEVHGVTEQYALAYIKAILPEVSDFCSRLGPPFPTKVAVEDLSMGESQVSVKRGRLAISLRLKSGYLVIFAAGHVWAVHAPDAYYTSPWWREEVRQSKEYHEPARVSEREAVEKVRGILLGRLGLEEKSLFLNNDPVFSLRPNASATNGIRRYVLQWQRPETEEQRQERTRTQALPELSVSAEVDAVSGDIKSLNFFHRSLEQPDPKVQLPLSDPPVK